MGLEYRMDALKTNIRPKLEFLGNYFAPTLSSMLGEEIYPHVAKHARRTINPPNDTWVAFQLILEAIRCYLIFKLVYGEPIYLFGLRLFMKHHIKQNLLITLQMNIDKFIQDIPDDFVWSLDHMKPDVLHHKDLSKEDLTSMFVRLQSVKKAEILCGYQIPRDQAIHMSGQQILDKVDFVFNELNPLYKML